MTMLNLLETTTMTDRPMTDVSPRMGSRPANALVESGAEGPSPAVKMQTEALCAWFGKNKVLKEITLPVLEKRVTALIGPSGCGKSTFIRCLNRLHEVIPGAKMDGRVLLDGSDVYILSLIHI